MPSRPGLDPEEQVLVVRVGAGDGAPAGLRPRPLRVLGREGAETVAAHRALRDQLHRAAPHHLAHAHRGELGGLGDVAQLREAFAEACLELRRSGVDHHRGERHDQQRHPAAQSVQAQHGARRDRDEQQHMTAASGLDEQQTQQQDERGHAQQRPRDAAAELARHQEHAGEKCTDREEHRLGDVVAQQDELRRRRVARQCQVVLQQGQDKHGEYGRRDQRHRDVALRARVVEHRQGHETQQQRSPAPPARRMPAATAPR